MNGAKLEAQKQWNRTPCGTGDYLQSLREGSRAYFDEIRRSRYEDTDPWMPREIDFGGFRGKRLLEIGHGLGTDLLTFAENGAEVYGIDITERHHKLAMQNFAVHGREAVLKLCDAASIDFPSDYFDVVYSNGVLHHTHDTVRCISEAYRVLKPGGKLILTLYNRRSAFLQLRILLVEGLLRGKLSRLGREGLMATIEHGADGISIKPLVKTYSRSELRAVLGDFRNVKIVASHLQRSHVPAFGRLLPSALLRRLELLWGWYLVANADK